MIEAARWVLSHTLATAASRTYSIGICSGASPLALTPRAGPALSADSVSDAVATGVADPFMVRVDGTWHLFFEAITWRHGKKKGEIGLATSRDAATWSYRGIVLGEPFHLSYPCVFEHGGDFYMVPESHRARAVRLYRAARFPDRWVHVATLLGGAGLVDATPFRSDGRWWMLVGSGLAHDTLRLYASRELEGPWVEHPRSPIVAGDAGSARPAGRVISLPGRLIRFAQVCRPSYGTSVRAFEITGLSPRHYVESPLDVVLSGGGAGWNRSGMHHVDAHEVSPGRWIACVDGWAASRGPRRLIDRVRGRR